MAPKRTTKAGWVGFLPDYRHENPYQTLLAGALCDKGWFAEYPRRLRSLALRVVRAPWRPTAVHVHWPEPFGQRWRAAIALVAILLVLRLLGGRVVYTVHNLAPHDRKEEPAGRWLRRWLLRTANVICMSEASKAEVLSEATRVTCIPHGEMASAYPDRPERAEARRELGLAPSDFVALCYGQIKPYKGFAMFAERFAAARLEPSYRLIVAGKPHGEEGERIRRTAANSRAIMVFLEHATDEATVRLFAAADVVVLPSVAIHNSGSVVLAMSLGRAVIAPSLPTVRELLGAQSELLFDPARPESALERLRAAKGYDLAAIGAYNRTVALSHDWTSIAHRTSELYRG